MKFLERVGNGAVNKGLNFGGDPDHRLDTWIVFRIRHYWEIRKVVDEHKYAAHTDSPDGGTGKACLGGGMNCASASSFFSFLNYSFFGSMWQSNLAISQLLEARKYNVSYRIAKSSVKSSVKITEDRILCFHHRSRRGAYNRSFCE